MGVNGDVLSIDKRTSREFSLSCDVTHRKDGFSFSITTVYGTAYEEKKKDFLNELYDVIGNNRGPCLIGRDFNLVRYQKDKSNGIVDLKWCGKFNEWIDRQSTGD
jgi:lysine/ornithine N-monooxygenase